MERVPASSEHSATASTQWSNYEGEQRAQMTPTGFHGARSKLVRLPKDANFDNAIKGCPKWGKQAQFCWKDKRLQVWPEETEKESVTGDLPFPALRLLPKLHLFLCQSSYSVPSLQQEKMRQNCPVRTHELRACKLQVCTVVGWSNYFGHLFSRLLSKTRWSDRRRIEVSFTLMQ